MTGLAPQRVPIPSPIGPSAPAVTVAAPMPLARPASTAPGVVHGTDRRGHHVASAGLGTPSGRHLVALDLDGTTLNHQGILSPATGDAVRRTVRAGHEVVVATGRSLVSTLPVLRELGLERGHAVCSNGAVTLSLDPSAPQGYWVAQSVTFDARPVLAALHGAWPDAHVAVEVLGHGFRVNEPFPPGELAGHVEVVDWADLADGPVTRVTFRSPTASADDFLDLAERLGLHEVSYAVGYTAWLDITPAGVTKASGLEQIRRVIGIPRERTVAVGDQRNDVDMLSWAACGVAMGDAPAVVVASADRVTGTAADDGLVCVLNAVLRTTDRINRRVSVCVP